MNQARTYARASGAGLKQWRGTDRYRASNLEAARIISADPVQYSGYMQEWARAVLARYAAPADADAGPLFSGLVERSETREYPRFSAERAV